MRVTIGELVEDFIPHTENGNKITQVEIVPRKIVEQIIYYCESNADLTSSYNHIHYDNGWHDAMDRVKERAEFLLSEFEKGEKGTE
jgi:hypothetical protein